MNRAFVSLLASCLTALVAHSELAWRPAQTSDNVVVLENGHAGPLLLARVQIRNEWHPAIACSNAAFVPYRGLVERTKQFELAIGGKATWVAADRWAEATALGEQSQSEVYLCRARLRVGEVDAGWSYGKAYRTGPHGGGAYLACDGREIELRAGFELLRLDPALGRPPIRPHPKNPQRFLFRNRPTVLMSVGEHYASLVSRDFDFRTYHAALAAAGLNQTRVFMGVYRSGSRPARKASLPKSYLGPWLWSDEPGGYDGKKFDLDRWNPEYFERLEAVLRSASDHGVVVEIVLFSTLYQEADWAAVPLNAANNVQGEGVLKGPGEFLTLRDPALVARQKSFVRRVVAACRDFDNVYFEIANEPYWSKKGDPTVTPAERAAWHNEMIREIVAAERNLPAESRHMIAVNEWHDTLDAAAISVLNLHYVTENAPFGAMQGLDTNSVLGKALVFDETEFARSRRVRRYTPTDARVEAWEFMLGGGSGYSNLGSGHYRVGEESGDATARELQAQIGALMRFLAGLDLVSLRRDTKLLAERPPAGAFARAISTTGKFYALYLHQSDWGGKDSQRKPSYEVRQGNYRTTLTLDLAAGKYEVSWIEPKDAKIRSTESLLHEGGQVRLTTPAYAEDIALTLRRVTIP